VTRVGMRRAAATQSRATADTGDWDTIFAVRFADVNAAITDDGAWPSTLDWSSHDDDAITLRGQIDPWRLSHGDNADLTFLIALRDVSVVADGLEETTFPALEAAVQVRLAAVARAQAGTRGSGRDLRLSELPVYEGEPLNVIGLSGAGDDDEVAATVVSIALQRWLTANLLAFTHVFASIDPGRALGTALEWLVPNDVTYAATSPLGAAPGEGIFAVLSMTGGRVSGNAPQQVPVGAIPDGSTSAFLIHPSIVASHIILPGVQALFPGATSADFELARDRRTLVNVESLPLGLWELNDKSVVRPWAAARSISVTVGPTTIAVEMSHLSFIWGDGTTVELQITGEATLTRAANGGFALRPTGRATSHASLTVSDAVRTKSVILSGTVALAGLLAGSMINSALAAEVVEVDEAAGVIASSWEALGEVSETAIGGSGELSGPELAAEEVEAALAGDATAATSSEGYLARIWPKLRSLLVIMATATPSMAVGLIPKFIALGDTNRLPEDRTVQHLLDNVSSCIQWPDATSWRVETVGLDGSLQIGLVRGPAHDPGGPGGTTS